MAYPERGNRKWEGVQVLRRAVCGEGSAHGSLGLEYTLNPRGRPSKQKKESEK
jgi:hypothetical protein